MARWRSKDGNYEIVSRKQFCGTRYVDRFYSLAVCRRFDGLTIKTFTGRRGTYKTFEAAAKAVKSHRYRWRRFISLGKTKGRRDGRLRLLTKKQLDTLHRMMLDKKGFPKKKIQNQRKRVEIEQSIFGSLPLWIEKQADPGLVRMQFPDLHKTGCGSRSAELTTEVQNDSSADESCLSRATAAKCDEKKAA